MGNMARFAATPQDTASHFSNQATGELKNQSGRERTHMPEFITHQKAAAAVEVAQLAQAPRDTRMIEWLNERTNV